MQKHLAFAVLSLSTLVVAATLVVASSDVLASTTPEEESVVGGTTVARGVWPDAVAVLAPAAACTGTLIAPDVVLTAGHCIEVNPVEVIVNSTDYAAPGGEVIRVKRAIAYPDWEHKYDVGVLVLDHASATKPRPIASPCTAQDLVHEAKVRVVGFGLTTQTGTGDNSKLHQALLAVDDPTCRSGAGCAKAVAPNGEFTAGGDGKDACFGDSGGPVYLGDALIGVVSRGMSVAGKPCGSGGIYVRADTVVGWIEQTTKRKITRASCDKADGQDDVTPDASGCSVSGGGAGLPLAIVGLALMHRRRCRR